MQGLAVINALIMCSIFSVGSALTCYHCAMIDVTLPVTRRICGDEDQMISSDCSKWVTATRPSLVQTKFGVLPLDMAKVLGYNSSALIDVSKAEVLFKCAKMIAEADEDGVGKVDVRIHTCLAEITTFPPTVPPTADIESWKLCEASDNCYLCDEDDCNSASGIAGSLLLSILVALAVVRLY